MIVECWGGSKKINLVFFCGTCCGLSQPRDGSGSGNIAPDKKNNNQQKAAAEAATTTVAMTKVAGAEARAAPATVTGFHPTIDRGLRNAFEVVFLRKVEKNSGCVPG